jgi:hypothetical protein
MHNYRYFYTHIIEMPDYCRPPSGNLRWNKSVINTSLEEIVAVFRAYDPKVEVSGESVLSFIEGVGTYAPTAKKMLGENGISDPKAGLWYSQQSFLNGFKQIAEKTGPMVLKSIGKSVPEHAKWPASVNSIETGLSSIEVAYHMNHRNGQIGNYKLTKTGPRAMTMVCDNPYPDYFDFGIIEAVARKFSKPGEKVKAKIDDSKSQRDNGAESTTYIVEW